MPLVHGFLLLIGLQLLGDFVSETFSLPVPGPVIGMLVLLGILIVKKDVPNSVATTAGGLIRYIGLLFVPAGAGISLYLVLIADQWLVILGSSMVSTLLTLICCAFIYKALRQKDTA